MGRMIDEDDVMRILDQYSDTEHIKGWVHSLPTAEPERKKGKWIYEECKRLIDETDDGPVYCMEKWWKCSECGDAKGFVPFEPEDNFCPNCGCDMRQEGEQP